MFAWMSSLWQRVRRWFRPQRPKLPVGGDSRGVPELAEAMRKAMAGEPQRVTFDDHGYAATTAAHNDYGADVVIETTNNPLAHVPSLRMLGGPAVPDPTFAALYQRLFGKPSRGDHTRRRIL